MQRDENQMESWIMLFISIQILKSWVIWSEFIWYTRFSTDYFVCRLVEKFNIVCGSTILLVFTYTYATIGVTFYVYVTLLVESTQHSLQFDFCILIVITFFYFESAWKLSVDSLELSALLVPLIEVFWAFAGVAFFCELGEMMTHQFDKFNKKLYENCDWHLLPIKMQRTLVIFMSDTQKPVHIQGYGHIRCIRENFKKVEDFWFISLKKTTLIKPFSSTDN